MSSQFQSQKILSFLVGISLRLQSPREVSSIPPTFPLSWRLIPDSLARLSWSCLASDSALVARSSGVFPPKATPPALPPLPSYRGGGGAVSSPMVMEGCVI